MRTSGDVSIRMTNSEGDIQFFLRYYNQKLLNSLFVDCQEITEKLPLYISQRALCQKCVGAGFDAERGLAVWTEYETLC